MKVWLVTVIALFALVELYQWVAASRWLQQIALLPMPILLAAGLGLAIASNAKKHLPWQTWTPPSTSPLRERERSSFEQVAKED